ncbi:hypothetical protein AB0D38_14160 [Streptomyces sp. NPDC048279]|jgi:hypothetical protein|uniref:hypothetical protein n=1 Tax=Streptomyces sp. NPDC048279 TaxID=3154714 RepID=UPI003449EF85
MSGQPYTLPEGAVEWVEALKALRDVAGAGQIYPFREQLAKMMRMSENGQACSSFPRWLNTSLLGVFRPALNRVRLEGCV